MFQQFFERLQLFGREFRADLLIHLLHDRAHFRSGIRPDFVIALLAISNDFFDFFVLLRREVEHVVQLLNESFAHYFSEAGWWNILRMRQVVIFRRMHVGIRLGVVSISMMRMVNMVHQQAAG